MKAVLLLDPNRREEQLAFITDRAQILRTLGDQIFVSMPDEKADLFVQHGIHVQPQEGADLIQLPAVLFDPQEAVPSPPAPLTATPPAGDDTAYYIIQFMAAPEGDWIRQVQYLGGLLVENVPVHAAVFRLSSSQADNVRALGDFVRWVGLFHPAYAMSFEIAGRDEPFSAQELASMEVDAQRIAERPEGALTVSFFSDRDLDAMRPLVEAVGARVVDTRGSTFIINVSKDQIPALLRVQGVWALEIHRAPMPCNQRAGIIMGANQVRNFGNVDFLVNLDGSGEVVGVFDTGLDSGAIPTTHTDFDDATVVPPPRVSRVVLIDNLNLPLPAPTADSNAGFPSHGTRVAGSIVANGQNAPVPNPANPNRSVPRGIAPAARLAFTAVNHPPSPNALNYTQSLVAMQNHYNLGARVHNNSWGGAGGNLYTPGTSRNIDIFAFLHPESVVLFASGNDEADLNNNNVLDQSKLGDETTCKNTLTIGASENVTSLDGSNQNYRAFWGAVPGFGMNRFGTNAASPVLIAATAAAPFSMSDNAGDIGMFSCRGRVKNSARPTHKRVKPDLVAPGTNILSTRSTALGGPPFVRAPNTAPAAFYQHGSGTSIATPLASGSCLLVRQFYRSRFGQLRRPLLLETQAAPFVDLPCAAANNSGALLAWIHPDAAAGPNHLVAAQYAADLSRTTNIVQIAANVGAHPAPAAIGLGANTCFLYRDSGSVLRLLLRDAALAPVAAFGTAGVVTLAPVSRAEDDRRPALGVNNNNEIAAVWFQTGTDNLMFQRFRADTGAAIDAAAKVIGAGTHTSPHPYLLHNGTQWAVFWGRTVAPNFQLLLRFIDNAGNPVGAQPVTVLSQAQDLREPHAVWDARQGKFMVAYVSSAPAPNRGICTQPLNPDGTLFGAAVTSLPLAAANSRRPRLSVHPDSGFALLWEDNSQNGRFDVYFSLLDSTGAMPAGSVRISDTPIDSSGFSAMFDNSGFVPVWQSSNEIRSNLLGVYALRVLKSGLFQAQADPATPLIANQTYVSETLAEFARTDLTATAIAWGGGEFYLARLVPNGIVDSLELVRTDADGRPLAVGGTVALSNFASLDAVALSWRGNRVLVGVLWLTHLELHLVDLNGAHIPSFGASGKISLTRSIPSPAIFTQLAQSGSGPGSRFFAVYGEFSLPTLKIRYTVRNAAGGTTGPGTVAPRDLVPATGTAKHGWFHLVPTDVPPHFIAAWHVAAGPNTVVQLNKFLLNGNPQAGIAAPIPLTARAGDAQNPVIAPRPVTFAPQRIPPTAVELANLNRREYGAAWQHRSPGGNWQVLFSRLQQNGRPSVTAGQFDVVVAQSATDHAIEPQLVWHTDGYGLAWLQQPVAGGNQQLFFTILDQNGVPPNLAATGAPATPATNFAVSTATVDVKSFHLIWTGRSFRISWTEVEGGRLRHKLRALAVPRVAGGVRYDAPFQQPSSALVRATLINGATNILSTALPNVGNNVNDGYGWGRINLRQALSPAPPVTFFVRDDGVVGQGRTVTYNFPLPPNTQFLRVTLVWTDPPGNNIVNHLHLVVTTPAFNPGGVRVFHGNRWQTAPGSLHLSDPVVAPIPAFEDTHTVQQVVISGPPALPSGNYKVEVIATAFDGSLFQQFPGQPFALVFVGSGREIPTAAAAPAGPAAFY